MLGEKLFQITGRITGQRILPGANPGDVKTEMSFQGTGTVLGISTTESGTYEAVMQAPGVLFAKGQGLSVTAEGEAITWHGSGIVRPTGKGMAARIRGAIYYTTQSTKLARLNGVQVVFEWDVDESGGASGTTWEWN